MYSAEEIANKTSIPPVQNSAGNVFICHSYVIGEMNLEAYLRFHVNSPSHLYDLNEY
jgi:hypothetical protein